MDNSITSSMTPERFAGLLPFIATALVERISEHEGITENVTIDRLYASKLYAMLEDERTKLWTYSADKLCDLFTQEETCGALNLPDC